MNPVTTLGIVGKTMTLTCVARDDSQPSSLVWLKNNQVYTTGVTGPTYDRLVIEADLIIIRLIVICSKFNLMSLLS